MESIFTSPQLAYFAKKKNGQSYFAEKPFYHGLSHVLLGCLGVHLYISTYSLFCKKWTYFAEKPSYHGPSHALLQGCFGVHLYISTIGLLCTNMDIFRRKAILSRPLSCSVGLFEDPSLHLHNWPILHYKWPYLAEKPSYRGLCHVRLGRYGAHLHISTIGLFCIKNGHIWPKSHFVMASVTFVGLFWGPSLHLPDWTILHNK